MKKVEILRGIILKTDRHKEFDLRLVVLHAEGLKTLYATGALRPSAKLRGALQLFNECEFSVVGSRVTTALLTQNNTSISKEIHRFYLASSISNSTINILKNETSDDNIYDLVFYSLKTLATTDTSCYKIFIGFYAKLLMILGYGVEDFEHSDKIDEFLYSDLFNINDIDLGLNIAKKCVDAIRHAYLQHLGITIDSVNINI